MAKKKPRKAPPKPTKVAARKKGPPKARVIKAPIKKKTPPRKRITPKSLAAPKPVAMTASPSATGLDDIVVVIQPTADEHFPEGEIPVTVQVNHDPNLVLDVKATIMPSGTPPDPDVTQSLERQSDPTLWRPFSPFTREAGNYDAYAWATVATTHLSDGKPFVVEEEANSNAEEESSSAEENPVAAEQQNSSPPQPGSPPPPPPPTV